MKMYTEAHLEPNQTSMVKPLCENQKKLYFKCSTVSKYASGIGFTVEKVYRMSICHFGLRNPGYNPALNFLRINIEIYFDLNLFRPS